MPLVKSQVPYSRSFDKLVFREGFGKTEQYLLLDGYGRGKHYRYDTNAILRFTTDDRVFLVGTDDDQRVAETFHNTLTFIRDGRGHAHVPPFAELEAVADLPNTGFSISTVDDYAGLKWTRNIVWLKGSLFVVVDQVESPDRRSIHPSLPLERAGEDHCRRCGNPSGTERTNLHGERRWPDKYQCR